MASRRKRWWLVGLVAVVIAALAFFFGRGLLAWSAKQMARRAMGNWALTAAERWIARAAWLDPDDAELDLMRAACYRRWGLTDPWRQAVDAARRKGASAPRINREIRLAAIRSGQAIDGAERQLFMLVEAGVPPHDVVTAFLEGYLGAGAIDKAQVLLVGWQRQFGEDPHVKYLWGVYCLKIQAPEMAMTRFQEALEAQPAHELARKLLAELFEARGQLDEALREQLEYLRRAPDSVVAQVGVARTLRKMGCLEDARHVLEPLVEASDPAGIVCAEVAQIELEKGDYRQAAEWFARAGLEGERDSSKLSAAAIAFALSGQTDRAERLFARHAAATHRSARIHDLRIRLVIDPQDQRAAAELHRLSRQAEEPGNPEQRRPGKSEGGQSADEPRALYNRHCTACHGVEGDATGPAARHLYPPPRDFRTEKFRLVRARNGAPTSEDVQQVTRRGMPGTSMPAFDELSPEELELVAGQVLQFYREGVREQLTSALEQEDAPVDPEEISEIVEAITTPDEFVVAPRIGPPESQSVRRGRELYLELGCNKCHGDDGMGSPDAFEFDEKGRPSRPRDLVHEPFKGGDEPESIYLRIVLGMPGTPHPATWNLSEDDVVHLVHYCQSLSRQPKRELTNHQHAVLAHSRDYLAAFSE